MPEITQFISSAANVGLETAYRIVWTIIAIVGIWAARRIVLFVVFRRVEDARRRYGWRKVSGYLGATIGAVALALIWLQGIGSLATFAGLFAAGIAIALRDIIVNLAGWLYIVARRPLVVGDRIQVGDFCGDVIDIRLFAFTILEIRNWVDADQSTGRVVHVPNGQTLMQPLANYNQGFSHIWNEIPVLLTFESNWKKAKELLEQIAREHAENLSSDAEQKLREASKRFMIYYTKLTPAVYTKVSQSGVLLTIRYLTQPQQRRTTEAAMWEDILTRFAEASDIEFAYPTTRFFDHIRETMSPDLSGAPATGGAETEL